jgi:hypothetical protein
MKNPLLKDLWHYQNGFSEKTICHPSAYHNKDYLKKYKDSIEKNRPINPQGFRSHYDFLDLPEDTFKIGFFGCSITEGVGLCEEHIWISMFLEEFKNRYNKNAIALNFGKGGCSNNYITWNVEKAFEEVDLDLVCVQFTQSIRRTFAKPHKSIQSKLPQWLQNLPFVNIIFSDDWGPARNGNISMQDFNCLRNWICSDENNYLNTIGNIKLTRTFLREKNVPFILNKIIDTKSPATGLPDRGEEFNVDINLLRSAAEAANKNGQELSYARALDFNDSIKSGHPGLVYHEEMAKTYLNQYEKIININ